LLFKSQYVMSGKYDSNSLGVSLTFKEWVHQPDELWKPCK
jgi:hypothetical protein